MATAEDRLRCVELGIKRILAYYLNQKARSLKIGRGDEQWASIPYDEISYLAGLVGLQIHCDDTVVDDTETKP